MRSSRTTDRSCAATPLLVRLVSLPRRPSCRGPESAMPRRSSQPTAWQLARAQTQHVSNEHGPRSTAPAVGSHVDNLLSRNFARLGPRPSGAMSRAEPRSHVLLLRWKRTTFGRSTHPSRVRPRPSARGAQAGSQLPTAGIETAGARGAGRSVAQWGSPPRERGAQIRRAPLPGGAAWRPCGRG